MTWEWVLTAALWFVGLGLFSASSNIARLASAHERIAKVYEDEDEAERAREQLH